MKVKDFSSIFCAYEAVAAGEVTYALAQYYIPERLGKGIAEEIKTYIVCKKEQAYELAQKTGWRLCEDSDLEKEYPGHVHVLAHQRRASTVELDLKRFFPSIVNNT